MSQPSKIKKSKSVPGVSDDTPRSIDASSTSAKPNPAALRHANTRHWLMKNEPPFSLAALKELPEQTEPWVGVRSGEARNMMQHGMKKGHHVLYYNASIANPHIAGIARVASEVAYPDPTAFDAESPYFDAESDKSNPRWHLVDVKYEREFTRPVYLSELRALAAGLHNTPTADAAAAAVNDNDKEIENDKEAKLLQKSSSEPQPGNHHEIIHPQFTLFRRNRLSIHPLTEKEYEFLVSLESTPLPSYIKLKPEKPTNAHPSRNRGSKSTPPTKTVSAPQLGASAEDSETKSKNKGKPGLKRASTHGWNKKKRKTASKESDSETENEDEDEDEDEEEEWEAEGQGNKKKSNIKTKNVSAAKRVTKKSKTETEAATETIEAPAARTTRSRK